MGSLSSRPKVPSVQPQIISVPTPAPSSPSGTDTSPQSDAGPSASDLRSDSLLSRNRSRFGTIRTSFRGLLGLSDGSGGKKTLLGE